MSSSLLSTHNAPAQRVPAWKRLGLKLKAAEEQDSPTAASSATVPKTTAVSYQQNSNAPSTNGKRKPSGAAPAAFDHSPKKARRDIHDSTSAAHRSSTATLKKQKSVSFANEDTVTPAKEPRPPKKPKQQKAPKQPTPKGTVPQSSKLVKQGVAPVVLDSALAYLRQWKTDRESWKFNKNHQTKLLEHVFDTHAKPVAIPLPSSDIGTFYEYISGLKGFVRTRLCQVAEEVKKTDMEQGSKVFSGTGDKMDIETKQAEYENTINEFLQCTTNDGKRSFDEVEYVLRTVDKEMQRRTVKRMRAEMVLDELSDGKETVASTTSAPATENETSAASVNDAAEGDKRIKLNDGSQQRIKRRRKMRTGAVDDESSSNSESDSDSDSESESNGSSESSSSDDSDDDELEAIQAQGELGTSSSSSSSSDASSDSEEESDDAGDD